MDDDGIVGTLTHRLGRGETERYRASTREKERDKHTQGEREITDTRDAYGAASLFAVCSAAFPRSRRETTPADLNRECGSRRAISADTLDSNSNQLAAARLFLSQRSARAYMYSVYVPTTANNE